MQLLVKAVALLFLISFAGAVAPAAELYESHLNARALGMGGAYNSVVDDEESLWFNPAGIAKNMGIHWTIIDPKGGISSPGDLSTLKDLQNASTFNTALASLYGKEIWAGGGAKSAIILPFFAGAYYYDANASILADNPVNPTLSVNYVTDQGFALGTGFSIAQVLEMGFVTRYINRTGVRKDFGPAVISDIMAGTSKPSTIFDNLNNKGTGYALDLGGNITIPGPVKPTLSFVWKNMGNTTFRASTTGGTPPPSDDQDMQVGASLLIDAWIIHILPAIEIREIMDSSVQLGNKMHLGVELGVPLLDLRAGIYQGYATYGFGLNLGLLEIEGASWETELGGYPGQLGNRRYMVQATLRLGFDFLGGGSGGSKSGAGGAGGSAGSGGSGGSGGGSHHMKVRR